METVTRTFTQAEMDALRECVIELSSLAMRFVAKTTKYGTEEEVKDSTDKLLKFFEGR
jgi:hypothetical protein